MGALCGRPGLAKGEIMLKKIRQFRNTIADLNPKLADAQARLADATEAIRIHCEQATAGEVVRERLRKKLWVFLCHRLAHVPVMH
jgi:hypothetical protein